MWSARRLRGTLAVTCSANEAEYLSQAMDGFNFTLFQSPDEDMPQGAGRVALSNSVCDVMFG